MARAAWFLAGLLTALAFVTAILIATEPCREHHDLAIDQKSFMVPLTTAGGRLTDSVVVIAPDFSGATLRAR